LLNAMKSARELREASVQMGRQILRVATNIDAHPLTVEMYRATQSGATPGHHAVAFGAVGAAMDWPLRELATSFLYSTCAGLVAASLRLLPLGQLAGQRILWGMHPLIGQLADEMQDKELADIWSFAPMLEIAAMRHEVLEARLFRS
jgi:urease accessory protein